MDYDSEKLGKEVRQLSKSEIETNKYREKRRTTTHQKGSEEEV